MAYEKKHYEVKVYYEATDINGHVNNAQYMNFFSRAREEIIGFNRFKKLVHEDRTGFMVYNANLKFRGSARLGDVIDIQTTCHFGSEFRLHMHQEAWRQDADRPAVIADFEIVCVNIDTGALRKFPVIPGLNA